MMESLTTQQYGDVDFPEVSVLLPVRNGGAGFVEAIHSILNQTFSNFELLIIDDGSSDASVSIARNINDPRIHVFVDGMSRGLATRLNEGIQHARGAYIARMDADDVSFCDRFERQLVYLRSHPEIDLLATRAVVFRGVDDLVGLLPFRAAHEEICAALWRGIPMPHPTWMGKTAWFRKHGYRIPETIRAEDQELLLRAAPESRYACLEQVLLGYRQGSFLLGKVWLARRQLLRAQLGLFYQRRQWSNWSFALGIFTAKLLIDVLSALPGCDKLFFLRMSGCVPKEVEQTLRKTLSPGNSISPPNFKTKI